MMKSPEQLADYYQQACELELQAFKPGNVSIYADGHGMTVDDFRRSAEVSAQPLCHPDYSLGEKIFYAVKATREAVGCNTNLGILLLCAPLLQAWQLVNAELNLRQALQQVLMSTTIADAEWVFKAISLAAPGGLGEAKQQDVHEPATVTLLEAMEIASDRDRIALQYLTGYQDIFDFALPTYYNYINKWSFKNWSAVAVYIALLSRFPDSHIERKYGQHCSQDVTGKMVAVNTILEHTENPQTLMPLLLSLDKDLKDKGINPGTTADLTVASLLAVFLQDSD